MKKTVQATRFLRRLLFGSPVASFVTCDPFGPILGGWFYHGNLRVTPQCHSPQEIRALLGDYYGHWAGVHLDSHGFM